MTQITNPSLESIDLDTFLARLAAYVHAQRRGDPCLSQIAGEVLLDSQREPRRTVWEAVKHCMDQTHSGVAEMWEWQAAQKVWLLIDEHARCPLIGDAIKVYARSILPMDSDGTSAYEANREAARNLYSDD